MRASKYNHTTRAKLLMYISDGRTVKDVCSLVGISDMTLTHWRRQHPDFDEEYLKSVESQWRSLCKKDWSKDLQAKCHKTPSKGRETGQSPKNDEKRTGSSKERKATSL